jgi:hypothetical protein
VGRTSLPDVFDLGFRRSPNPSPALKGSDWRKIAITLIDAKKAKQKRKLVLSPDNSSFEFLITPGTYFHVKPG